MRPPRSDTVDDAHFSTLPRTRLSGRDAVHQRHFVGVVGRPRRSIPTRCRATCCRGCDTRTRPGCVPIERGVERRRHDAGGGRHVERRRDRRAGARHQERRVHHVVQRVLTGRGDEERAVGPFDEGHHADESDVDRLPAGAACGRAGERRTGGGSAERNSTDKITTIHLCSCSWGAIDRSRTAPTHSKRRVDGRSALLRCVGLV